MSSGYFPLNTYDEDGKALTLIAASLSSLIDQCYAQSRELDVPEDALRDGGYIERLTVALEFIRGCIRVPQAPPNPVADQSCQLNP